MLAVVLCSLSFAFLDPYVVVCGAEDADRLTRDLLQGLEKKRINVFSPAHSIRWGQSIVGEERKAIQNSTHGIVVVSRRFLSDCESDAPKIPLVANALLQRAESKRIALLPLRLNDITEEEMKQSHPPLGAFSSLQFENLDQTLHDVTAAIRSSSKTQFDRGT